MVATSVRRPLSSSARAKSIAARIGPTVWELEGPIPILKRSKTEIAMRYFPPPRPRGPAKLQMEGARHVKACGQPATKKRPVARPFRVHEATAQYRALIHFAMRSNRFFVALLYCP